MAFLLDMLTESSAAKPSLKHGGLVRVRRALRSAPAQIPPAILTLLALTKASQTPLKFVTLLGVSIAVLIRLKHTPEPPVSRLPGDLKDAILSLYTTTILMSKTPLPPHIANAFDDFISTFITPEDFSKSALPTLERAMLRSPEICLPTATKFYAAYPHQLDEASFKKAVTQAVNSSKSANATVRADSVLLFKAILENNKALSEAALSELLALPKTGKSAGPDHRVALYTMLGFLPSDASVSSSLLQSATPLLGKENNEAATSTLAAALPSHIAFLLRESTISPEVGQLIAKELANSKPAVRRAFANLVGTVFYENQDILESDAAVNFAKIVIPALEKSLQGVASNPLNAPGGPIEGYIAVATLLGPLSQSGKFSEYAASQRTSTMFIFHRRRHPEERYHRFAGNEHHQAALPSMGQGLPKGNRSYGRALAPPRSRGSRQAL